MKELLIPDIDISHLDIEKTYGCLVEPAATKDKYVMCTHINCHECVFKNTNYNPDVLIKHLLSRGTTKAEILKLQFEGKI